MQRPPVRSQPGRDSFRNRGVNSESFLCPRVRTGACAPLQLFVWVLHGAMNEFQRWLMVAVEPTSMASLRATPPQNQGLIPSNAGPGSGHLDTFSFDLCSC